MSLCIRLPVGSPVPDTTAMQAASKQLYECISEVYEPDWTGHDLLTVQSQSIEMLWQDLGHKMTDQVLIPLNTYQGQFPEMRVRALLMRQMSPNSTHSKSTTCPGDSSSLLDKSTLVFWSIQRNALVKSSC